MQCNMGQKLLKSCIYQIWISFKMLISKISEWIKWSNYNGNLDFFSIKYKCDFKEWGHINVMYYIDVCSPCYIAELTKNIKLESYLEKNMYEIIPGKNKILLKQNSFKKSKFEKYPIHKLLLFQPITGLLCSDLSCD